MKTVKSFYKDLPFNFTSDINFYTKNITQLNQIHEYKDLHFLLSNNNPTKKKIKSIIEFGCGTGWLSNTISYYYQKNVKGIDFTEKSIQKSREVAEALNNNINFELADIFDYEDENKYDLVISLGVLHHTKDCKGAFKKISKYVKKGGYLYVGLYHLYGRRPMLNFLQGYNRWHGKESALKLFSVMNPNMYDSLFCKSWFNDQVLHPHETQHTLSEVSEWINEIGFKLKSTSINKYKNLNQFSKDKLDNLEREKEISSYEKNVNKLEFDPGYFTICAQK